MPTILAALLLAPLAALHATDQVTNAPTTGDVHAVRVVRTADEEPRASLLGQPTIALWKEKHLAAAYQKGIARKGDMGSSDAIASSNDGDSWSIPGTIFDHEQRHGAMQFGYCNAVLYHPPGQEGLWCFAMRCPRIEIRSVPIRSAARSNLSRAAPVCSTGISAVMCRRKIPARSSSTKARSP